LYITIIIITLDSAWNWSCDHLFFYIVPYIWVKWLLRLGKNLGTWWYLILSIGNWLDGCGFLMLWCHVTEWQTVSRSCAKRHVIREEIYIREEWEGRSFWLKIIKTNEFNNDVHKNNNNCTFWFHGNFNIKKLL